MTNVCGCCDGISLVTPVAEINPPGLTAIAYRAGTYATFFETMLARLSNLYLDIPSIKGTGIDRIYPLRQLTARDPSDPSIALLDAWAVVADVLTFYQERIANEGYLPTALERRSVLELARLVGYRLRPGVAASVYLAFTVATDFNGQIPAGTRAQSVPGAGETAQFFETSELLGTRDAWNSLRPRLTRPQVITPPSRSADGSRLVTGVDVIDALYVAGIATNLKPGDPLLFVFDSDVRTNLSRPQQFLRVVEAVDPQADAKRTEVTLAQVLGRTSTEVQALLPLFIDTAKFLFAESALAQNVRTILENLLSNLLLVDPGAQANLVRGAVARIQEKRDIAVKRQFTRLSAWTGHILQALRLLISIQSAQANGGNESTLSVLPATLAASPLANLTAIMDRLARAPSIQPSNATRLTRSVVQSFSPQSDTAPRLLAAFKPAAATSLYQAWSNFETPRSRFEVFAPRVKATLFASSFAGQVTITQEQNSNGTTTTTSSTSFTPPTINLAWASILETPSRRPVGVPLDATYEQIKPGSWVAIDRPSLNADGNPSGGRTTTFHFVTAAQTAGMDTTTGLAAKVTLLTLDPPWLSELDANRVEQAQSSVPLLRGTIVYAQTELLTLAEEPLDADVDGNTIELAGVYDGLEAGRWIIVSGDRTDVPNVSGVSGSELVMLSAVAQGSLAPQCAAFPVGVVPFSTVFYTTPGNAFGDRLVVGQLAEAALLNKLSPPAIVNQQYCEQVQLAAGVYANAYVPSQEERGGNFGDFEGLLVDPDTGVPFPGGNIGEALKSRQLFAWRISSQQLTTIVTLANKLAYSYARQTVTLYGNVARATNGQSVGEVLGNGDGSQAFQSFPLRQSPLTYVSQPTPAGADAALTIRVNDIEWHRVDNLAAAGPKDRTYITNTDDADRTTVIFGDGQHAARLPTGLANVKVVYRFGIGKAGNVQAGQISQLATHPLGAQAVINPLPASGGADRDSADQARRNTPLAVAALDRLVSVQDYADFARTYAGIGKASAVRLSDGRRQLVHLTIAGVGDIPIDPSSDLYHNLVTSLTTFGDPRQPLQVCVRRVKLLVISARVQILPDYQWETVEPTIRAALLDRFDFDKRDLGQGAFLSEAVRAMQDVAGVSYVDVQVFDGIPENITASQLAALGATLTLRQSVRAELAHPNPTIDPATVADGCQRILPAELVFLTPAIRDTLVLTPIGG